MRINVCSQHDLQYFTEPARPGHKSYCMKCLAEQVKKKPRSFFLTDEFKKQLELYGNFRLDQGERGPKTA